MKKNKNFILAIVVFVSFVLAMGLLLKPEEGKSLNYNEFLAKVDAGDVSEIEYSLLSPDMKVTVQDEVYKVSNPKSNSFKEDMLKKDIEVKEAQKTSVIYEYVITIVLRLLIILGVLKLVQKSSSSGLISNKSMFEKKSSSVKFSNIAGSKESMQDMQMLVRFLKEPKEYEKMGAKLPKGALLYGPPGTGKTLTAKAIAGEAGVPFYAVSGSDFVDLYAGMGARKVRKLFEDARKSAPCIIFIDEIDSLAGKRGLSESGEKEQTINALLAEMDGFTTGEGVIILGATNRLDMLDPAILRPGRFDRHISIGLPDLEDRESILNLHISNKKLSEDIDVKHLAKMTIGFSGASLAGLINEATIIATNNKKKIIELSDIDEAYIKMLTKGHVKENNTRSKEETELIAYHEAGHALSAKLLTKDSVPKVTITPTTSGAGGFTVTIPEKMGLLTKEEIQNEIIVLYSGRAAELILRGDSSQITTGASNDIRVATSHIKSYFETYGMSDKYGMLDLSQYKVELVDESVKFSKELYSRAYNLLNDNKDKLELIAKELIKKESITEDELNNLIYI